MALADLRHFPLADLRDDRRISRHDNTGRSVLGSLRGARGKVARRVQVAVEVHELVIALGGVQRRPVVAAADHVAVDAQLGAVLLHLGRVVRHANVRRRRVFRVDLFRLRLSVLVFIVFIIVTVTIFLVINAVTVFALITTVAIFIIFAVLFLLILFFFFVLLAGERLRDGLLGAFRHVGRVLLEAHGARLKRSDARIATAIVVVGTQGRRIGDEMRLTHSRDIRAAAGVDGGGGTRSSAAQVLEHQLDHLGLRIATDCCTNQRLIVRQQQFIRRQQFILILPM